MIIDRAINTLQLVAEKGLPSCYASVDDFLYDFYPDFSWDHQRGNAQIQQLLADKRFPSIQRAFLYRFKFDMRAELTKALAEPN